MSDTSHHHRRDHLRENPSGAISQVSETLVKNTGPRTGKQRHEVADQHDGLIGLINPDEESFDAHVEDAPVEELTLEEKAANASLLNRLMGQDVVDDTGRPLDEEAARLLTIKNLIETLQIELHDDGEVDDIVFALESSDWSSEGFNRKGHLPWAALGLDAKTAGAWRDSGFTPFNVGPWIASRYYGSIPPEDAAHYHAAGVSVDDARQWYRYDFPAEAAVGWIQSGSSINDAHSWNAAGIETVQERSEWRQLGVIEPRDAGVLKRLGGEAAARWVDAEVDLHRATAWTYLVKDGCTEKDLAPFINGTTPLSHEIVGKWQEEKIPTGDIYTFMQKGYTPKRALSRIKKGQSAAQSEDLRGKEVVPGKAWKELKAAIRVAEKNMSNTASVDSRMNSEGMVTVEVIIDPAADPSASEYDRRYARSRRYNFRFSNTGRFISATGSGVWRGSVRKVTEMVDIVAQ